MTFQKLVNHRDADAKSERQQFVGDLCAREVGPEDAIPIRITRSARIDDLQEGVIQTGEEGQAGTSAAPFFRAWLAGKGGSEVRRSIKPR